MNQTGNHLLFDRPGRYRIRVQGELDARWSGRLNDMAVTVKRQANRRPVTTLTGEMRDQAALMGVLNALYDLGYPLLKVERIGDLSVPEQPTPKGEAV